jgi:ferredoxin
MRVTVDTDLCQGHAMCVLEAPDVFAYDSKKDDHVRVLIDVIDDAHVDAVKAAVRFCPTMALTLDD